MNLRNRPSKLRRGGILGLLLLLVQQAVAWLWIVIVILVIVVGTIVIIKLNQLIKRVLPDEPAKEQVTRIMQNGELIYDSYSSSQSSMIQGGGIAESEESADPLSYISFTIQYGIRPPSGGSNEIEGWVSIGTSLPPEQITDVQGDPEDYSYNLTGFGEIFHVRVVDGVSTVERTFVDRKNYIATIERTVDFVEWVPIFTNTACLMYCADVFVDTNAPPERAFYRLR